ncbi:MAG: hypothetical protein J0I07_12370, partial [Myxococcales bacterium]|nr:hypothetical protein [Myxococcales bacterium]
VLSGMPSVVFEAKDASRNAAIDGAIAGTERAVRRSIGRTRAKPITPSGRAKRVRVSARG